MKRVIFFLAILAVIVSCSKESGNNYFSDYQDVAAGASESVQAFARDFEFADSDTKTFITQSGSNAPSFAWKEGDVIGVIPMNNENLQSNYKIAEIGSDPKLAVFDGGVWALKAGKEYAAYYPFRRKAAICNDTIQFSFLGQTQTADNSLAHLGNYDYMYASSAVPQGAGAQFNFEHKICLVRLQLDVPNDTFTRLKLESEHGWFWFANGASMKLSDGTMTSTQNAESVTVGLDKITTLNNRLTVWFAMLPTSTSEDQRWRVRLFGEETIYDEWFDILPTTFTAGSAYSYAAALRPEYQKCVDLGLSVRWATYNVGASKPEEKGNRYAWGEHETKTEYTEDNYKYFKRELVQLNKYDWEEETGFIKYVPPTAPYVYRFKGYSDDRSVLECPYDDVANNKLSFKWRMPTREEIDELIDNCRCDWVTVNNVDGWKFTGKKEGYTDKWIFLPAGVYWSSSLNMEQVDCAHGLFLDSNSAHSGSDLRENGNYVRAVSDY